MPDYYGPIKKYISHHKSNYTSIQWAKLYLHVNMFDQALQFCDQAIAENPKDASQHYIRSLVHLKQKNADKALSDMNIAVTLEATNPLFYYERALIYMVLGDKKKACTDYEHEIVLEGYARWWILPSPCAN
jgi:tetratricopeptide (TPR) repeat protein